MKKNKILPNENVNKAIRVSTITLIINLILSLLKFAAGYIGKSSAMLSDAVHSASDVLSTIIVMVGIKISEKRPDREHPYGHERMECVASIILAFALAVTGAGIGYSGIKKIFSGQYNTLSVPGGIALTAAVVSLVIKKGFCSGLREVLQSIQILTHLWLTHGTTALTHSRQLVL